MPLVHLERGQTIKPFEGRTEFLPVDLVELLSKNSASPFSTNEPVLSTDVIFEGVGGQLLVAAHSRIVIAGAETPLGKVKTDIEHDDEVTVVREVPLHLQLEFWVNSREEWQRVLENRAVFSLGNNTYPVKYHLESADMTGGKLQQAFETYKTLPAIGSLVMPESYRPARVLLPYDVGRLSHGINLTMGRPTA